MEHASPPAMADAGQSEMEALTIPQIITFLRSSFERGDFERATRILLSRQQSLRAEIERDFAEDLTVKEVEKIEIQARCDGRERDLREEREKHASLVARLVESEREKSSAREEAERCRGACEVLEAQIVGLCERVQRAEEKLAQLLETQKEEKEAEQNTNAEIDVWKRKFAEMEARFLQLEKENSCMRGREQGAHKIGTGEDHGGRIRARPSLKLEVGSRLQEGIIEIIDSEDDMKLDVDTHKSSKMMQIEEKNVGALEDDGVSSSDKNFLPTSTPKRKCTSRIFTSDSEDDEDEDCIPLSKLRRLGDKGDCSFGHNDIQENATPSLRRLVPLRELDETRGAAQRTSLRDLTPQNQPPIRTNKRVSSNRVNACRRLGFSDAEDDDIGSESEGESLGGFIVGDSDGLGSQSSSKGASEEEETEQSDSDVNLDDVLAKIRREKDTTKWEYEADMLSAFGKNVELCMRAVCLLWRLQTREEQSVKQAIFANNQGFNKLDAERGSTLAEFLTEGDPYGPVKKTVQELQEYDPKGPEYCRQLAIRYSRQLFSMYQNCKESFFNPS